MAARSPQEGGLLLVRVLMTNRMMARSRHWDTRLISLRPKGLVISTEVDSKTMENRCGRTARGLVFHPGSSRGIWQHGGLVNVPVPLAELETIRGQESALPSSNLRTSRPEAMSLIVSATVNDVELGEKTLNRRATSDPLITLDEKFVEFIPAEDIVCCLPPIVPSSSIFQLQIMQHDHGFGSSLIHLEIDAKTQAARELWVSGIQEIMASRMQRHVETTQIQGGHTFCSKLVSLANEWLDWFRFPVRFLLRITIPDMKSLANRQWYIVSFIVSMCWLAFFSFCVVNVCDILHDKFNISTSVLGMTVAAIGTSLPNVASCVAVAKQGKTAMAIANALGANIQNVFLALAIPWMINSIGSGPVPASEQDLTSATVSMIVTLAILICLVLCSRCALPKWAGALLLATYFVYFTITLIQQFKCSAWPFCT
jgi:Ca2+/Na+ antiporter